MAVFRFVNRYVFTATGLEGTFFGPTIERIGTAAFLDIALILGYFQWEYGVKGVPQRPETFGPGAAELASALVAPVAGSDGYGAYLRAQLSRAESGSGGFLGGVSTRHALRVVQANEERGQLYEEIQIAQQQGGSEPASSVGASTPYLDNFRRRVGDDPVAVIGVAQLRRSDEDVFAAVLGNHEPVPGTNHL